MHYGELQCSYQGVLFRGRAWNRSGSGPAICATIWEETRKQIVEKAKDGSDFVASKSREIRKHAEDIVDQGKDLVSKQKARLADVLESGKQTVRETFAR